MLVRQLGLSVNRTRGLSANLHDVVLRGGVACDVVAETNPNKHDPGLGAGGVPAGARREWLGHMFGRHSAVPQRHNAWANVLRHGGCTRDPWTAVGSIGDAPDVGEATRGQSQPASNLCDC